MTSGSWEDMGFQIVFNTVSGTASGIIITIVLKFLNDYISNKKICTWSKVQDMYF